MVAAGAEYTQNRSWFAGAAYTGFWKNDRIRYRGVFGFAHLNLKYYGIGGGFLEEHPAEFSLESVLFLQQLLLRVGESPFMLGGRYFFSNTKVVLFDEERLPEVDLLDFDLVRSGIELITEYETFNNFLSPSKGMNISLSYS